MYCCYELLFPLGFIHLDTLSPILCPLFLCIFFFFNNIYEHLTNVGLEWGANFVGTSSNPYISFCSCLIKKDFFYFLYKMDLSPLDYNFYKFYVNSNLRDFRVCLMKHLKGNEKDGESLLFIFKLRTLNICYRTQLTL